MSCANTTAGIRFERVDGGDVRITWPDGTVILVEAASWKSTVASVSAAGETHDTFWAASHLHDGVDEATQAHRLFRLKARAREQRG